MNYKSFSLLLLILYLLFSCNKKRENDVFKKIDALQQITDTISKDSMEIYLKKVKKLFAKNRTYPDSLKAENNFLIGKYFDKSNNVDSAIFYYNKAIEYDRDSIISKKEFIIYSKLITKFIRKGNYIDALNSSNLLLKKIDSSNYQQKGLIYNYKVKIYINLHEYANALYNNSRSLKNYRKTSNVNALNTVIYARSDIYYFGLQKKDSAKIILKNLLKNENKLTFNNKYQIFNQLGIYYFYDGNFLKAKDNYINALKNIKKFDSKFRKNNLAVCYNNLAEVNLNLKNYTQANKYLDSTFLLGYNHIRESSVRNTQRYKLRLLYETEKKIQPILNYLDTIQIVNERNYKRQMDTEFLALTKAVKNEQLVLKQKQQSELKNSKLKKKQLILLLILILLMMFTFIGILYFRKKKIQYNRDEILLQQRLFRAQMNPHFTSNILYSIQNLFKTDIDIANDYLIKFSRLLRLNLENSIENYVSIEKELEAVEKYLELQKLRFPNTFDYQISGNCIDDELLYIPPMLIQPFVENAIEHAFKDINYKGFVEINLNFDTNLIFCEIIDNGIGISSKKSGVNKQSTSTKLIKKLIKKLTQKDVLVTTSKTNATKTGTCVQFYIPYKKD